MDHLLFNCEWKAADAGQLDGYMSVFGNIDHGGDVVRPGAFRKTFGDWSRAKSPMPLIADHQLSTDGVIGSVVRMAEDAHGARVKARFSSIAKAQDIRTRMMEGHLSGMSFTYEPVKFSLGRQEGRDVRFLDEVKVFEATVTPFPMNELALASAKAVLEDEEEFDFENVMAQLLGIHDRAIRAKFIDAAVARRYQIAAVPADGPDTAPVAVDTEDKAVDTVDAATYATALMKYPEPSEPLDGALDSLAALEAAIAIERFELDINDVLGKDSE